MRIISARETSNIAHLWLSDREFMDQPYGKYPGIESVSHDRKDALIEDFCTVEHMIQIYDEASQAAIAG